MKITKIKIRNILGVSEAELDGRSVELQGGNGTGKTSIIDAIRLALTNTVKRDVVIKKGATEGEVLIETNSGLSILRKNARNNPITSESPRETRLFHRPKNICQICLQRFNLTP